MEPIQPLFASAVARLVRPAPLTPEKVVFAWRMAVGAAIARVTRVRLTAEHTLDVEFEDERWSAELERSSATVLQRVQDLLGAEHVQRLSLRTSAPQNHRRRRRQAGAFHTRLHEGDAS